MSLQLPSVDPNDLYYRDRLLAVPPDPVEFAKIERRRVWLDNINLHYVVGGIRLAVIGIILGLCW